MTLKEIETETKSDKNDEQGWILLPNGNVLTVDCYTDFSSANYPKNPTNSENMVRKQKNGKVREVL